jgi:uncharacterized protein
LSQVELARRAGIIQSVVSAYESGARQPSLPTLERLVRATGYELTIAVRKPSGATQEMTGPLASRLVSHRSEVLQIALRYGLTNLRVFGSVARGQDTVDSDVDLLVDVGPGVGLMSLARAERDLERLLGARVDLVPVSDLKAGVAASVLGDARPL